MFKIIWNLIKVVFITILLALIFQQFTARFVLTVLLRADLGVPVEVDHAQIDLLRAEVRFQDVQIWNPEGFPPEVMIYIREIRVDSNLFQLFRDGGLQLNRLEMDVDNLRFSRSQAGELNLFAVKIFKNPLGFSFLKNMKIDEFVLSAGRAGFFDARGEKQSFTREIGLRRMTYRKAGSLRDVFDILGWEALKGMRLESLGRGYLDQIAQDLDNARLSSGNLSPPKTAAWH